MVSTSKEAPCMWWNLGDGNFLHLCAYGTIFWKNLAVSCSTSFNWHAFNILRGFKEYFLSFILIINCFHMAVLLFARADALCCCRMRFWASDYMQPKYPRPEQQTDILTAMFYTTIYRVWVRRRACPRAFELETETKEVTFLLVIYTKQSTEKVFKIFVFIENYNKLIINVCSSLSCM